MEFLLVRFPRTREVLVDGHPNGWTNTIIPLPAGTYTVALGTPRDFSPDEQKIHLEFTAALDPYTVTFHVLPPSAIQPAPGTPP